MIMRLLPALILSFVCSVITVFGAPHAALAQSELVSLERLDQVREWRAVGLIEIGRTGTCTGTLIDADLVLTAAHCLVREDGSKHDPETLVFRAAFQHGQQAAVVRGAATAIPPTYDPTGDPVANGFAVDVGLIRLNRPVLSTQVRPFRVVNLLSTDDMLAVVSYGQGRNDAPSLQSSCEMLGVQRGVVIMDCEATFGSSGAPIFVIRDGGPRIASVLTGTAQNGDVHHSVGVPLTTLLPMLRRQINGLGGEIGAQSGASVTIVRPGDRSNTGARFVSVGE